MDSSPELKPVIARPGRPLYLAVKDALREAIDAGVFQPGAQMPSTKQLSEQLSVSLVTAHRALQELVSAGVLQRSQGKGTFVHEKYLDRRSRLGDCRIGLLFHEEASLGDYYHSQILQGVHEGAQALAVDLILLRFGEDARKECNGYLLVNPLSDEVERVAGDIGRKLPTLVVGARSDSPRIHATDVDNVDLARQAAAHLVSLGHKRLAYIGGADQISNSKDRWIGFMQACQSLGAAPNERHILKAASWRLDEQERMALIRMLSVDNHPTAVFAAGYYFALDVYGAAATIGRRIPQQLSVLGVDDPPSAAHLSPPMTTLRQPLVQLGHAAVTALVEGIKRDGAGMQGRMLKAELVVRQSTAPPS